MARSRCCFLSTSSTQAHVVMVLASLGFSAGIWNPRGYINSRLVPAASSCRLEPTVTAFFPGRPGD